MPYGVSHTIFQRLSRSIKVRTAYETVKESSRSIKATKYNTVIIPLIKKKR